MSLIKCKNVSLSYDGLIVANNISFEINKGEFCVIVGASGAGKTTILNILGGMDQPTEEKSKSCDRQVQSFRGDSLVVEIDGLLYNGTINCMFDTDSFPGIV